MAVCMVILNEQNVRVCRCENDHGQVWLTVYSALCGVCGYVGVSHDHGQDDCVCDVYRSLLSFFKSLLNIGEGKLRFVLEKEEGGGSWVFKFINLSYLFFILKFNHFYARCQWFIFFFMLFFFFGEYFHDSLLGPLKIFCLYIFPNLCLLPYIFY